MLGSTEPLLTWAGDRFSWLCDFPLLVHFWNGSFAFVAETDPQPLRASAVSSVQFCVYVSLMWTLVPPIPKAHAWA